MTWRYFNRYYDVWIDDDNENLQRLGYTHNKIEQFKLYRKLVVDYEPTNEMSIPDLIKKLTTRKLIDDKYILTTYDEDEIAICHWEEVHNPDGEV